MEGRQQKVGSGTPSQFSDFSMCKEIKLKYFFYGDSMKYITTLLITVSVFFLLTFVIAQEKSGSSAQTEATLNTEISFDYDSGIPTKLSFDVRTARKKVWLGVSYYPASFKDALREGEHQQIELNGETWGKVVKIGKKFSGGTFEAAIWGKKVMKSDCTIEDCYWCSKNGFHLDELLAYKSGALSLTH